MKSVGLYRDVRGDLVVEIDNRMYHQYRHGFSIIALFDDTWESISSTFSLVGYVEIPEGAERQITEDRHHSLIRLFREE